MNTSELFELINETEFNEYKHSSLIFYTYNKNNELQLLLKRPKSWNKDYTCISTPIYNADTSPALAIARIMVTEYRGLFSQENLKNLSKNHEITLNNGRLTCYELISNNVYTEWIDILAKNPVQFDSIKNYQVYFQPIEYIDIKYLNEQLKNLSFDYTFAYYTCDNHAPSFDHSDSDVLENSKNIEVDIFTKFILENIGNVKDFINASQITETSPKYVVLTCFPNDTDTIIDYGYLLIPSLFMGIYRKNKENWIYCRADLGEFPGDDILLKNCKGIVLPGSILHIYDNDSHVLKTISWLKQLISNPKYSKVKILGNCFGQQLVATAMGREVKKNKTGFSFNIIEEIELTDSFWDLDFVKKSNIPKGDGKYRIAQAHLDEIIVDDSLSENQVKILGSSKTCQNEVALWDNGRIFTTQGHPEYTAEFYIFRTCKWIYKCNKENMEKSDEVMARKIQRFTATYQYGPEFRHFCHSFLKN